MLEKYWKIGHDYYKEYKDTRIGNILASIDYSFLPSCHKAGTTIGNKIIIGSFGGADKVAFEAFYNSQGVDETITARVDALEGLFESKSGNLFLSTQTDPEARLSILENKCKRYVWDSLGS